MRLLAVFLGLMLILSSWPTTADQSIFHLNVICPEEYAFRMKFTRMIVDEFMDVGIDVSLEYMPMDEVIQRCFDTNGKTYSKGGFDVAVFGWRSRDGMDAEDLYYFFHSDSSASVKSGVETIGNCMSWENTENDELIEKLREEKDDENLKEYWMQWQQLFYEEQPQLTICSCYSEIEGESYWAYQHVSLNMNHPVLKNNLVRQALSHLIPRQSICNLHNKDKNNWFEYTTTKAEPCAVPVNPDFWAFDKSIKPYAYDVELAKELLFKAGYNVKTEKHETAESLLEQAEEKYSGFEFEEARDLAAQARDIYQELGDNEALADVVEILARCNLAIDAETLLTEGIQLRGEGEYEKAREKLISAQTKFQECGLAEKAAEANNAIFEIDEFLRKETILQEADSLFEQGKQAFDTENYESALDLFTQAREKYQSVESERVAECDEWIEKTKTEMERPCLGTILVALLVCTGFLAHKRTK
ncbi:MAG: ABC transporter substrate-binding protein [Candidatus Methanofastidiosia archaeon]